MHRPSDDRDITRHFVALADAELAARAAPGRPAQEQLGELMGIAKVARDRAVRAVEREHWDAVARELGSEFSPERMMFMAGAQPKKSIVVGPLGPWMPPRSEVVEITPEQATAILEHCNTKNRAVKPYVIDRVRLALLDGTWRLNGETVIFSHGGRLLDGQNRLHGCVRAKVAIKTWVVFGQDPDVFRSIDRGASRSLADDFSIMGEKNCALLSAATRIIESYAGGTRNQAVLSNAGRDGDVIEYLAAHPAIRDSISFGINTKKKIPVPGRIAVFAHYLFGLKSPEARDEFFEKLITGAGMEIGNPILTLRTRIYQERIENPRSLKATAQVGGFLLMHLMIRAWNAFRRGDRMSKIIVPREESGARVILADLPNIE